MTKTIDNLKQELDELLQQKPKLRKQQEMLQKELKGIKDPEIRIKIILRMVEENLIKIIELTKQIKI